MGNKLAENDSGSMLDHLSQQYQKLSQDGRGIVLLHKQTKNRFLLKQYTFCSLSQFHQKKNELQLAVDAGPRDYVISPLRFESTTFSSFCSTSYKIYAVFEYPHVTLKEEIAARQKQNKGFEEAELWSILQSCTDALGELKPLVSLNPNQIFLSPEGQLKIIHDDLVDQNYRAILTQQIYYAPQKIKNFYRVDTQFGLRKESIFSMGMTLLETAYLDSVAVCYDYSNCSFQELQLSQILQELSSKYSAEFVEMLTCILQVNPNRRASLMQVQKMLEQFWSAEQTQELQQNKQSTQPNQAASRSSRKQFQNAKTDTALQQKCLNAQKSTDREQKQQLSSARYSKFKQRQITISNQLSSYKLAQPQEPQESLSLTTPKNQLVDRYQHIYTDPKLLEMIKKDLQDISKLKHCTLQQTSKYTYLYPQTQSILDSIKRFQTEPRVTFTQSATNQIQPFTEPKQLYLEEKPFNFTKKKQEPYLISPLMKKRGSQLVYTVQTYENGRRYEGTTLNGKKQGRGKLMFGDGAYYEGQFKEDRMNGQGILYYRQNQTAYDGQWVHNQFQGKGILYNQCPQVLDEEYDFSSMNQVEEYWLKYQGQFKVDNKSGKGRLYLTNGQIFQGEFDQDYVNGIGRYFRRNGEVIKGVWSENVLTKTIDSQ